MRRLITEIRARWLGHLAGFACAEGRYESAERLALRALALAVPGTPLAMIQLNQLGMVHKYQGRYAEGRAAYRRALAIARSLAPDPLLFAGIYHNLGGLEHSRARWARAEVFARRSLAIRECALGPDHLDVARDLAALAAIVDNRGRHREAEALYRRALTTLRRARSAAADFANALANLAACLHRQGRGAAAEGAALEAVAIGTQALGAAHPETVIAAANLGVIRRSLVRSAEAERT